MKLKLRLCYRVGLITLLFVSGLIIAGIIFPALAALYKPTNVKHKRDALKLAWLGWFGSILSLKVIYEGMLPVKAKFWVSNHISWLDIIVLGSFSPAHFVAKSDLLTWPVIGFLAKQGGTIFVRRGDKQQAKTIAETLVWQLKTNNTVIAFPEGTTTKGDEVMPFHASLFQSALLTKSAIQPIAIKYMGEATQHAPFIGEDAFIPHLIRMLSLDKIEVRVDFLPTISTAGKNRQSVSTEARAVIMDSISGIDQSKAIALKKQLI